jgi:ectoine hydroxylase-related dioxygenase (phytanoyl-CoA dioxygenase family)
MEILEDSTGLRDRPDQLQKRIATDGYIFLRRAVDPERVTTVRHHILEALGRLGWLARGSEPDEALPGESIRREGDDAWWGGYAAIQSLESFHELAHDPAIVAIVQQVIGEEVLVHPRKIARITYPGSQWPTPPHQDFPLIQGATDTITAWVPFGDCSREMGGLRLLVGSHLVGLRQAIPAQGVGGVGVQVDSNDIRWRTVDYKAGDLLLFMSLTVHWAPPNTGASLRLSADYRYQAVSEPIVEPSLRPHSAGAIPEYAELAAGWKTRKWIEYPNSVRIISMQDPFAAATVSGSRFTGEA